MNGSLLSFLRRLVVAWLLGSTWPSIWALLVPGVVMVGGMCFMVGSAIAGDDL